MLFSRLDCLNPLRFYRFILSVVEDIDSSSFSHTMSRPEVKKRVFITVMSMAMSLLMINYLKNWSAFLGLASFLSSVLGEADHYLKDQLRATGFIELTVLAWWTLWHFIGFVVIPCLVIKYVFKERITDMGWKLADTAKDWKLYACLVSCIIVLVYLVTFREDFIAHYPFYRESSRSWLDLLMWECLYLTQFVCLEFFFRGYVLQSLRPAMGVNAIWVMVIPYMMIHFPKPWLEASGSIVFGVLLGLLALRSRSIWGGVLVHFGIAISMDVFSLIRKDGIPTNWLPF